MKDLEKARTLTKSVLMSNICMWGPSKKSKTLDTEEHYMGTEVVQS